ncbi:ATP-binding protein [Pseudomonas sp. B21-056]|uniref:ATP-binding protein n=1 Tax=Pseudomonas sp. B21-056 TaxID=2895495 RepID=UPI00222F990F|nr:ATP-binding protein [Pseudomonas sp. B21-056]UZE24733.1 ATP-binding protein [Pseudomonas sp. B21-056]
MEEDFNIGSCKVAVAKHIELGACNRSVVDSIRIGNYFAPIECEIIDYKESFPSDSFALAKLIRHVVAFYNTFGGYLIFGVKETVPEQEFQLVGCDIDILDLKQLKDKIYSYVGSHISIAAWGDTFEDQKSVLIIYIPKRLEQAPAYFGKNGPSEKGSPAFNKGATYLRLGDNSVPAEGSDLAFLFGERACRYLTTVQDHLKRKAKYLEHNLPDRNFICPRFIGQKAVIELLWQWFADEFSCVRVLAGEGGLGKTSIAYEFSQQVCITAPVGIQRVLWLTAKKEQFVADADKYLAVPETHYACYRTLVERLCLESAISEDEIDGADEMLLRRFLKNALTVFPTLVVVDDVDSLSKDDQRRVLELAMQFSSTESRFLLTTRMNPIYSPDLALEIEGLKGDDYSDYVRLLSERFKGPELSLKEMELLYDTTHGSPLFTESLYRLIRRGQSTKSATTEWRDKKGVEARSAALKREISSLTSESKRVLLAVSILHSCSLTELRQATHYTDETLSECLDELSSLFLVSAPRIGGEPRYEVLDTVASLVVQNKEVLVPDHAAFQGAVTKLRKAPDLKGVPTKNNLVGNAINEATAFLRANNVESALTTVMSAQRRSKYHPDLYLMQGRCFLSEEKPRYHDARRVLQKAYEGNVRKPLLFDLWYETEIVLKHWVGALAVANLAIEGNSVRSGYWMMKRSVALIGVAKDYEGSGIIDMSLKCLNQSADSAYSALPLLPQTEHVEVKDLLFEIHDLIARQGKKLDESAVNYFDMAQNVIRMTQRKDVRRATLFRLTEFFQRGAEHLASNKSGIKYRLDTIALCDSTRTQSLNALDFAQTMRPGETDLIPELKRRIKAA